MNDTHLRARAIGDRYGHERNDSVLHRLEYFKSLLHGNFHGMRE